MTLDQVKIGQKFLIKDITANDELKKRFYSFGIIKGANVKLEAMSLKKNTLEINVEDTLIALRIDEAKTIKIKNL